MLFEGFDHGEVDGLFYRAAGEGAPVLLLHGYPQTSAMWHAVAPALAEQHCVLAFDLPGYGRSAVPDGTAEFSKRRMAARLVGAMAGLGHARFTVVAHDRGARVGYRMALDHAGAVQAISIHDIVPTSELWDHINPGWALKYYHWMFLAQPEPLPETLIGHDPGDYLERTMASWTKAGDLGAFHPDALAEYIEAFRDPARLHATCEDYRAGATIDAEDDRESLARGELIGCPCQVLWGEANVAGGGRSPIEVWRRWAPGAEGHGIDAGHFVDEENPSAVLAALVPFLSTHAG